MHLFTGRRMTCRSAHMHVATIFLSALIPSTLFCSHLCMSITVSVHLSFNSLSIFQDSDQKTKRDGMASAPTQVSGVLEVPDIRPANIDRRKRATLLGHPGSLCCLASSAKGCENATRHGTDRWCALARYADAFSAIETFATAM
jgi:hypothetical protein